MRRFLHPIFLFVFLGVFFSFFSEHAFAAVRTWDGGGGADTAWSTCANWSSDTCPTTADVATFASTSLTNTTITSAVSVLGIDMDVLYTGTVTQSAGAGNTITVGSSDFILDGGTFTGGDATIDLNDAYTQTGGTFTSTSGSLQIAGAFTHTAGGTFTHNSGTVVFDGSGQATWNVATSEEFNNFEINNSYAFAYSIIISTGDTLNINGTLTLTDGSIGTGTLAAKGSTVTIGAAWGDDALNNGTIVINGSGVQTVTIAPQSSAVEVAEQFTINNANATVSGTGTVGTIYFNNVTVQAGVLALTGYNPRFAEVVTISGGTMSFTDGDPIFNGAFTLSSGVFTGGTGTDDFNGAITISGGTFTATSGTTTITAVDFTHTAGGTFTHNSGTVVFDGSGSAGTWNVATSEEFNNFEINTSFTNAHALIISTGDTLNINGTLTLTDGSIGTGTLAAKGSTVTIGAAWGHGALNGGTLAINGSSTQTVTIAPQSSVIEVADQLTINNASATVSGTGTAGTIYFDKVTVQAGTLSLTTYSPVFAEAFAVSGGTFTAGSGTVDHDGAVTVSSGTYTATSGTTTLGAGFTHSGGTFTHNSGTWTLDAGITLDLNNTVFYHVITNGSDGVAYTLSTSDAMYVAGNLTQNEGRFATSSATIYLSGNVTFGLGVDTNASGPILSFIGTGTQTVDATGVEAVFNFDTTVNKSSGEVRLLSDWTFNNSSQDLTIQEGTFDLNGFNLAVQGAATERLIVESGGNLQLQGGETLTVDSASYPQLDTGSTVTYDGTGGPYTMKDYAYHHLTINSGVSAVFTQAANESYAGNVTITQGILSQGGFTTSVTGTFSNSGTLRRLQTETFTGTMDVDSGTVEYVGDGDAQETVTITDFGTTDYYHLKINDTNVTKDIFALGGTTAVAGTLQVSSAEFQQGANALTTAAITVDGGTLTGGSSSVGVTGAVTISSGTFTSTSNTLTVSGGWTHTGGGTFTHNSGTVAFTGSSATADVSTTETFSALTINKTDGQTLTIASGDTLSAAGTLTLTDGAFATGALNPQANVVVGALWDAAGSGTVNATGSGTQTLDLSAGAGLLDNPLTINKAGGSFTLTSAYTLDHANADLTLTLGTFSTGDYTVTTSSGSDIAINGGAFNAGASTMALSGLLTVAGGTYNAQNSTPTYAGGFVLSSGAYTGSGNGDAFTGTLTISGGTFTASDATTSVASTFTHTAGGTFTHNGGTVSFTGNAATIDVATSDTFSSLTINKNNTQTLTIASGDSLIVTGTLTLTNGAVGTGTLEAQGGVSVGSGYDGGNAPLKFSGTGAQTFSLTGATGKYDGDIEVAKSSNTVSLGSDLVMDASGQDLTVTTGTLSTTGTNYGLTVAGNVAANGGILSLNGSTVDLNGNLTIGGGTLSMGTATITLAGDVAYTSGTMTEGTSVTTLDGTDQQFSGATTWGSLTKTASSSATLTFPADTVTTISGTLTLAGTSSSSLLSLRSPSAGTRATLTPTAVTTPSYLDIRDISITKATTCLSSTSGCVNSGNNQGWTFQSGGRTIVETPKTLTLESPDGDEVYDVGDAVAVRWSSTGSVPTIRILFSPDDGDSWSILAGPMNNASPYTWEIEESPTTEALLRVEGFDGLTAYVYAVSADTFTLRDGETVEETDEEEVVEETQEDVSEEQVDVLAEIEERVSALPEEVAIHGLVKLADDGNPSTQSDSVIYYIGADGYRHAFPNEAVYLSWFCDFSSVQVVEPDVLSELRFGPNITYRPGLRLVKFQSSPKTYAVDRFGVLRWITSEEVASLLYGDDWMYKIDDISDAFFSNYTFGEPIEDEHQFDPDAQMSGVVFPSDSLVIPGYTGSSGGSFSCQE